jgi:hypothetical protein
MCHNLSYEEAVARLKLYTKMLGFVDSIVKQEKHVLKAPNYQWKLLVICMFFTRAMCISFELN